MSSMYAGRGACLSIAFQFEKRAFSDRYTGLTSQGCWDLEQLAASLTRCNDLSDSSNSMALATTNMAASKQELSPSMAKIIPGTSGARDGVSSPGRRAESCAAACARRAITLSRSFFKRGSTTRSKADCTTPKGRQKGRAGIFGLSGKLLS